MSAEPLIIDQPSDEDVLAYALFPLVAKEFWANPAVATTVSGGVAPVPTGVNSGGPAGAAPAKDVAVPAVNTHSSKATLVLELNNKKYSVSVTPTSSDRLNVDVEGRPYEVKVFYPKGAEIEESVKTEVTTKASGAQPSSSILTLTEGGVTNVTVPMPGKVVNIKVKQSDKVKKGDVLFILEAMKMQNEICAPCDGGISEILIKVGDTVDNQTTLMKIKG